MTAVGLPFLGIVAMGLSVSLLEMASKIHPKYGVFYRGSLPYDWPVL